VRNEEDSILVDPLHEGQDMILHVLLEWQVRENCHRVVRLNLICSGLEVADELLFFHDGGHLSTVNKFAESHLQQAGNAVAPAHIRIRPHHRVALVLVHFRRGYDSNGI
jgi:hypothetical protein